MSSLWVWTFRLLLLLSLAVLCSTLSTIWPDDRSSGWIEIAGALMLTLTTGGVALWTVAAWIGNAHPGQRNARQ